MEQAQMQWKDITSIVDRAGTAEEVKIRKDIKEVNQKYVEILEEEIANHRTQARHRNDVQLKERRFIEEQFRVEQQKQSVERSDKKKKAVEYQEMNNKISEKTRVTKMRPVPVPPAENPFVKLVDCQDTRLQETREKMKQQNSINSQQSKLKNQERREQCKTETFQKEQFMNYVDRFYDKKTEDRNIFKRKYLKLNNLERSRFLQSVSQMEPGNVDKQYKSVNCTQIEQNAVRRVKKDEVDDVLARLNQHSEVINSSPAFIGRNPINYERKKQLEYLNRGLKGRMTTQPPSQVNSSMNRDHQGTIHQDYQRHISGGSQLPNLNQYRTINPVENGQRPAKNPYQRVLTEESHLPSEKPVRIKAADPLPPRKQRINTQPSELGRGAHRKYLAFDIILGRPKQMCL